MNNRQMEILKFLFEADDLNGVGVKIDSTLHEVKLNKDNIGEILNDGRTKLRDVGLLRANDIIGIVSVIINKEAMSLDAAIKFLESNDGSTQEPMPDEEYEPIAPQSPVVSTVVDKMYCAPVIDCSRLGITVDGVLAVKRNSTQHFMSYAENTMTDHFDVVVPLEQKEIIVLPVRSVKVGDVVLRGDMIYQIAENNQIINYETGSAEILITEKDIMGKEIYHRVVTIYGIMAKSDKISFSNPLLFHTLKRLGYSLGEISSIKSMAE